MITFTGAFKMIYMELKLGMLHKNALFYDLL